MKAFNWVLTGLLIGVIVWLLVTLILGVIYQPEYSNDIKVTVNFNNKPVGGSETVETTQQVPAVCPFSGEMKTSEVKTVVKKTKSEPSERRLVITEDAFKETMQQVAYTARKEAQNEYDKNFTTLLTILTIFGIAWPVIIALLQFRFNEKQINKIEEAQQQISDLSVLYIKINLDMASSFESIMTIALKDIAREKNDFAKAYSLYNYIVAFDNALSCKLAGKLSSKQVSVFVEQTFTFLDNIKNETWFSTTIDLLKQYKVKKKDFYSGKELKEYLGTTNIELYRKYRGFFIDLYPWKFDSDGE